MSEVGALCISARAPTEFPLATPPFGIYRLATDEWQRHAYDELIEVEGPAQDYLDETVSPGFANRIRVNDVCAATFMQRRDMLAHADRESLRFDRVLERVGNLAASSHPVTVPITRLAWRSSRIAALLDTESSGYGSLLGHRRRIARILHQADLPNAPVRYPTHVSLCRFSSVRLRGEQRRRLREILQHQVALAAIDSVELGVTIVGNNYKDPFTLEDWMM